MIMSYRLDKKFGDAATDTAAITAALDGQASSGFAALYPYYLVAVAAGVSVYFITRWLGRKS
jgi:hypothetical protein